MNKQQDARLLRINEIKKIIKLEKNIDFKALRISVMAWYGVSSRTAREYIEVAMSK